MRVMRVNAISRYSGVDKWTDEKTKRRTAGREFCGERAKERIFEFVGSRKYDRRFYIAVWLADNKKNFIPNRDARERVR